MRGLVLALVLLATPVVAATPVKVTADTFTIDEGANQATFAGNVVVTRDGFELRADKVVVRYGEGGAEDIRSFDATGKVRIKTQGQTAVGARAVFDPVSDMLVMTGDVEVTNSAGTVTGPELTVDLKTNTTVFKGGGNGRVTGVFTPQ